MIHIIAKDFNFQFCENFKNYFDKNNLKYNYHYISNQKIDKTLYTKNEFREIQRNKKNHDEHILKNISQEDIVTCWGWKRGVRYREAGASVLLQEHGYIFDRNEWISLGWNGLNGKANFLNNDVSSKRWNKLFKPYMKPWQKDGDYILLCGQVPGDASLEGLDLTEWYEKQARDAYNYYKLPVVWRPHPEAIKKSLKRNRPIHSVPGTIFDKNQNLIDSLKKSKLVITYNSNSAVNAVMEGIPVVVGNKGSMVYEIANLEIGPIDYPDRSSWGRKIAYAQWHISEIASGVALKHIFRKYLNTID